MGEPVHGVPGSVTPAVLGPNGLPARMSSSACPRCGKGPEVRVVSGGFGDPHDVCGVCGFEFPELTR